ncbi:MAG: ZIP family metal transporter [Candidatus Borkfalkiaceae bacterium]|nr:ZIP family metal transporter [Christensenellaceae bacterium]
MINGDLILGLSFIFIMSTLGAAGVFFVKNSMKNHVIYGFSAGVMIAASFWSLLLPAAEGAENAKVAAFLPVAAGVLSGAGLIYALDLAFSVKQMPEGKSKCRRMLIAVTIHNIPEGMAVGAAYGAIACGISGAGLFDFSFNPELYAPALGVALGIGIQNFPEGFATALPVKIACDNKPKAFFLGVLSGAVEPVSGLIGALIAFKLVALKPWILAFSAGAMLYVSARDLIPDSCRVSRGTWAFIFGFCVMTALDIAFG